MFPSNSNGLSSDLVSYNNDRSNFHKPFLNDINPNSKQDDSPLSIFHLPSPLIQYELELEDPKLFLQQQCYDLLHLQQSLTNDDITVPDIFNIVDSRKIEADGLTKDCNNTDQIVCKRQNPRKRPSKKDRHSKINTAKGPRDRRMRLSLDVARKFFDLQDMLGYDKASKTVEWLLKHAKSEIQKLERRCPEKNCSYIASSTSKRDVVTGIDKADILGGISSKGKHSVKEKKIRNTRKIIQRSQARDLRDKARARARERTSKKMWSRKFNESKDKELNQLGSLSSFEAGKEWSIQSLNRNHSLEVLAEVEEQSSNDRPKRRNQEEILDDAFVIMGKLSQSSSFNYLQNIGISQEYQFGDFQFFDKPSEVCNN